MRSRLLILKAAGVLNAEAPDWIQVFRAGTVEIEDGEPAVMDAAGAKAIIDYFERLKHDMVVDYEHQTLTGEQAPAAGWIRALEWRDGEGLWAKVDWTDKAAAYIASGEYRYHSPVFVVREGDRKITQLYNVALTNQPRTIGIAALAAKNIEIEIEQGDARMFEKLCVLLGLDPATATEDDVTAAVEKMVADMAAAAEAKAEDPPVAAKAVLAALGLEGGVTAETVVAKIESFKAPAASAAAMSVEVTALKAKVANIEAQRMIDEAVSAGKITPDELGKWGAELAKSNPEQFKLIVLSRQRGSMIPVDGLPGSKVVAGTTEPDDETREICKQLGITIEDWKKYNGKAVA